MMWRWRGVALVGVIHARMSLIRVKRFHGNVVRIEPRFLVDIIFADAMTDAGTSGKGVEGGGVLGAVDEFGPLDGHVLVVEVAETTLGASEDDEDDGADPSEATDDATNDGPGAPGGAGATRRVVVVRGGGGGPGEWRVGGGERGVDLAIGPRPCDSDYHHRRCCLGGASGDCLTLGAGGGS